jgi:exopolysaccharide biosynthesis polyprenyl glycosylphosphotransferase
MKVQFSRADLTMAETPLYALLALWAVSAMVFDVYGGVAHRSRFTLFSRTFEAVFLAGTLNLVITFFLSDIGLGVSRSFVLLFYPVCFLIMLTARETAGHTSRLIERRWAAPERIGVVGAGPETDRVVDILTRYAEPRMQVLGVVTPSRTELRGPEVLGEIARLPEIVNAKRIDRLVIVDGALSDEELRRCGETANKMGLVVSHVMAGLMPNVRVQLAEVGMLRLVDLRPVTITRKQELAKRMLDLMVGFVTLVLLAPVMLLIAMAVKLTSEGPVYFVAPRVGRGGRYFNFYKFRSMYTGNKREEVAGGNEKAGHLFKIKYDPRITPVGRFIRRYSLDELPQLFNVIAGDMSLVGPRPLPAEDLAGDGTSADFKQWADQRARVLPGITGLWQVKGRSDLDFEDMVRLDVEYVRNWSIWLDVKILLMTPAAVLSGRGAY